MGIADLKSIGGLKNTLNNFLEPPIPNHVEYELDYLHKMELITSTKTDGTLTNLGNMVIDLQIDPAQGLSMIMAYRLNCFREVSAIMAVKEKIKGSIDGLFVIEEEEYDNIETKEQNDNLKNKFESAKKDYQNMYGDHIAILKIFQEYENLRNDEDKLNEWTYKYFLRRNVLDGAYDIYQKMKYRYRNKLSQMELPEYLGEVGREILETDIKYRIMASIIYGNQFNVIKYKRNKFELHDGSIENIEIEKNSFINKDELTDNSKYIYDNLFRYGNNPVRAKIITKLSKKSVDIIKALSKS
jgi:HrpA-like RNA helicase